MYIYIYIYTVQRVRGHAASAGALPGPARAGHRRRVPPRRLDQATLELRLKLHRLLDHLRGLPVHRTQPRGRRERLRLVPGDRHRRGQVRQGRHAGPDGAPRQGGEGQLRDPRQLPAGRRRGPLFGCGLMGSTLMGSVQKYYLLTDFWKLLLPSCLQLRRAVLARRRGHG